MEIVGLTGTIGSGKSTAARILQHLGVPILDADHLAREVVLPGTMGFSEVVREFGPRVLAPSGDIDRRALGSIVFGDADARVRLNGIVHPRIRELFREKIRKIPPDVPLVIAMIPLLFEARDRYPEIRRVLVISAPEELILQRVMERDQCTLLEARQRVAAQIPSEAKEAQADWVIHNDGSEEDLQRSIEAWHASVQGELRQKG